jgi:hypothetical protein
MQLCVLCISIRSTRITTRRERAEGMMAGGRGGTGRWLGGRGVGRPGAVSGRRGSKRQWRSQEEGGQCGAMDGIGKGWDRNFCAAQACPLRASFDAQAAKPSTQLIVVRGRMNRSLLFYIGLGRLFNRSPFILVLRSIPFACRVLSSDAQQHSATAQA